MIAARGGLSASFLQNSAAYLLLELIRDRMKRDPGVLVLLCLGSLAFAKLDEKASFLVRSALNWCLFHLFPEMEVAHLVLFSMIFYERNYR
jgi:hypothetical protein